MRTYWDYTERERSELTEEQVKSFLDVEMMEKGILKVEAPKLKEVVAITLPKQRIFTVDIEHGKIGFETIEQAQKFVELRPTFVTYDWSLSDKAYYPKQVNLAIVEQEVNTYQGILDAAVTLKRNKENQNYNDEVETAYREALQKVSKVVDRVWTDWHECQQLARDHAKVRATLDEYRKLTGGNEQLAVTFLQKAFDADAIRAAGEWFGEDWTTFPAAEGAAVAS